MDKAQNLLNLIEAKERQEKKKRQRLILGGVGGAGAILGGVWLGISMMGNPGPSFRTYDAQTLTRSQVMSLFRENPAPILVSRGDQEKLDTIHSPEEFTLYLAAQTISVSPEYEAERDQALAEQDIDPATITSPLVTADIMPTFPGGEAALYRFLSNQIRYPDDALANRIEGKVYIRFVVQKDGSITDLDVLRGIGYGCDEEALRVVQMMPPWVPGELGGISVPVFSSLAIEFKFL